MAPSPLTSIVTPEREREEDTLLATLLRHSSRVGNFCDYNNAMRAIDDDNMDRVRAIVAALPQETAKQRRAYDKEAKELKAARLLVARRGDFFPADSKNLYSA